MLDAPGGVGVAPEVEVRALDAMGSEYRHDMGAVVVGVVDGLRDHEPRLQSPAVIGRDLAVRGFRVPRYRLPLGAEAADPGRELVQRRRAVGKWTCQPAAGHPPEVTLLRAHEVRERIADRAVRAGRAGVQDMVADVLAELDQGERRPGLVPEQLEQGSTFHGFLD